MLHSYINTLYFYLALIVSLTAAAVEPPDASTCKYMDITIDTDVGFTVNFGYQPLSEYTYDIYDEISILVKREGLWSDDDPMVKGVQKLSFDFPVEDTTVPVTNNLWGHDTTTTNFTVGGFGLFTAPYAGEYTFSSEGVTLSSALAVKIIDADWVYCCELYSGDYPEDDLEELEGMLGGKVMVNIPGTPRYDNRTRTFTLMEGHTYHMYFIYVNTEGSSGMTITMQMPNGEVTSDFTGMVGEMVAFDCDTYHATSTMYSDWEGVFTTTYSTQVVTHDMTTATTLETIYYVVTPVQTPEPSTSEEPSMTEYSSSSEESATSDEPALTEYSSSNVETVTEFPSSTDDATITDSSSAVESSSDIVTEPESTSDIVTEPESSSYTVSEPASSTHESITSDWAESSTDDYVSSETGSSEEIKEPETSSTESSHDASTTDDAWYTTDVDETTVTTDDETAHVTSTDGHTSATDNPVITTSTITVTDDDGHVYTTVTVCTVTGTHTITEECTSEYCSQTTENVIPPVTTEIVAPPVTSENVIPPVTTEIVVPPVTTDNVVPPIETTMANNHEDVTADKPVVAPTTDDSNVHPAPGITISVAQTEPTPTAMHTNPAVSQYPDESSTRNAQGNVGPTTDVPHVTTQLFPTASLYSPNDENGSTRHGADKLLCAVMILFVTFLV